MIETHTNNQCEQLLTVKQVANMLGIGKSTVWELARTGKLPKPIKLSSRITRWRMSDFGYKFI